MNVETFRRVPSLAATATATLLAVIGLAAAAPASAASNICPAFNAIGNFATADNVAAYFTTNDDVTTYTFVSLVDENPVNGVPGLVAYCVYTDGKPASIVASAEGANGAAWVVGPKPGDDFAFTRPKGAKSNIPLDGGTTEIGTATWDEVPTTQTILLHIDDAEVCADLYGTDAGTCFVKPHAGPLCDSLGAGDLTGVAYTSIPRDAVDCAPPSLGFEATSTSEFGDEVTLASSGDLQTLTVLFTSYGCSVSGHWYSGDCVSAPNATFSHPITARIYGPSSGTLSGATPGTLLATSLPASFTIPYRPSADSVNCAGDPNGYASGSRWFNTASQQCQYSIGTLITFTFPAGISLSGKVVWTVAFNTTNYGFAPIGIQACNGTPGGCGYDSLNVGTKTYPAAPYVGTDVDPNGAFLWSTWNGAYCDNGAAGTGLLRLDTGFNLTQCVYNLPGNNNAWLNYKPLGEIKLQ